MSGFPIDGTIYSPVPVMTCVLGGRISEVASNVHVWLNCHVLQFTSATIEAGARLASQELKREYMRANFKTSSCPNEKQSTPMKDEYAEHRKTNQNARTSDGLPADTKASNDAPRENRPGWTSALNPSSTDVHEIMQAPPLPEPPSNSVGTVSGADCATTHAPPLPEPPSRSFGTETSPPVGGTIQEVMLRKESIVVNVWKARRGWDNNTRIMEALPPTGYASTRSSGLRLSSTWPHAVNLEN
ncbi:hypothetical protein BD410DRAFT_805799 [Rickenella mellea]|uniref:Uncharacterized protein n=1 Tax=Rickenella mellea TaxID=50990 RepID=A0A4Y7PWH4_9AGAM|nr:hypothetical protein BD410DRAFT_805799 [Rickenella mellea]